MQLLQAFHLMSTDARPTELKVGKSVADGGSRIGSKPSKEALFSDFFELAIAKAAKTNKATAPETGDKGVPDPNVDDEAGRRSESDGDSDGEPSGLLVSEADPGHHQGWNSTDKSMRKTQRNVGDDDASIVRSDAKDSKAKPMRHSRGVEGMIPLHPNFLPVHDATQPETPEVIASPKGSTTTERTLSVSTDEGIAAGTAIDLHNPPKISSGLGAFGQASVANPLRNPTFENVTSDAQFIEETTASRKPPPSQTIEAGNKHLTEKHGHDIKDIAVKSMIPTAANEKLVLSASAQAKIAAADSRMLLDFLSQNLDTPLQISVGTPSSRTLDSKGNLVSGPLIQASRPTAPLPAFKQPQSQHEASPAGTEGRTFNNQYGIQIEQQETPSLQPNRPNLSRAAQPDIRVASGSRASAHEHAKSVPYNVSTENPKGIHPVGQAQQVAGAVPVKVPDFAMRVEKVDETIRGTIPASHTAASFARNADLDHVTNITGVTASVGKFPSPDSIERSPDIRDDRRAVPLPDTRTTETTSSAYPLSKHAIRAQNVTPTFQFVPGRKGAVNDALTNAQLSDHFTADELTSVQGLDQPRAVSANLPYQVAKPDMPQHIPRQLAEIVHSNNGKSVDLALSPEELGRVKLSITPAENGIMVHITAERPDTLDLIRRHIDQLNQELRQLGYQDPGFSFGQESRDPAHSDNQGPPTDSLGPNDGRPTSEQSAVHPTLSTGSQPGIDLRV